MTERLGKLLPKSCASLLSIERTKRENLVIILLTTDDEGFSRICLLSPYQVISTSTSELYFEVYEGSHTERNLNKESKATFIIQDGAGLLYVHGLAERFKRKKNKIERSKIKGKSVQQIMYHFKITDVLSDRSGSAPINSHMKFDTSIVGMEYQRSFEEMRNEINSNLE